MREIRGSYINTCFSEFPVIVILPFHSDPYVETRGQGTPLGNILNSPAMALLHSASIPSDNDVLQVKATIQEGKENLRLLDERIALLRLSLLELERHREEVQTYVTHHEAVLSPIRHLPPEILSEIFLAATNGQCMSWPQDCGAPWHLDKVCSYWRTVFISLPKLWSTINMNLKGDISSSAYQFLRMCLDRSGNELLTFSIMTGDTSTLLCDVVDALVSCSSRWKSASFDVEMLCSVRKPLSRAKNSLPYLQCLHLASSQAGTIGEAVLDAFEVAPRLRDLSLIQIVYPSQLLRVPWGQLTRLKLSGNTLREGEFTRILRQTPNLVDFSTENERVLEVTSEAVSLPHLTTLSVVNKGSYITRIFQLITAPKLTELHIHARTAFSPEHVLGMLRRSECPLTDLTLEASHDTDAMWEENIGIICLLAELPGLTKVDLRVLRASDAIIPRLTYRVNAPAPLLPYLQVFSLEDPLCNSGAALETMLKSRMMFGHSSKGENVLRSVSLKLSKPAPPTFPELEGLKDLADKKGLKIEIS
jgi:hypothetical protein